MSSYDTTLVGIVEEAVELTVTRALDRSMFPGWFLVSEVIDTAVRLELKKPLTHLIQQYDWRGEAIAIATRYGLQHATSTVLKRPLPEYLPEVRIRSHMTQQLAGRWYWYPTVKCDATWFDQLGHDHTEIARRNEFHADICFAIRDLLHETGNDLRSASVERVKAVVLACAKGEAA